MNMNDSREQFSAETKLYRDSEAQFKAMILDSVQGKTKINSATAFETIPIEYFFSALEDSNWLIDGTSSSEIGKQLTSTAISALHMMDEIADMCAGLDNPFNLNYTNVARRIRKPPNCIGLASVACFERMCACHANLLLLHLTNKTNAMSMKGFVGYVTVKNPEKDNGQIKPLTNIEGVVKDTEVLAYMPRCFRSSTETLLFRPCFSPVGFGESTFHLPSFRFRPVFKSTSGQGESFALRANVTIPLYVLQQICSPKDVCKHVLAFYGNMHITVDQILSKDKTRRS